MIHLLSMLLPMALAAGVSPMMLSEQMIMLNGPAGRREARHYLAGAAAVVLLLVALVLTVGHSLSLPTAPHLSAGLDLGLGVLLLGLAALAHRRRPEQHPTKHTHDHRSGFAFGVFSMATNFTTLPLVVAAAKNVASSGAGPLGIAVGVPVLVAGACLPAWLPFVLDRIPASRRALDRAMATAEQHGGLLLVLALVGVGVFLVVKGALGILG